MSSDLKSVIEAAWDVRDTLNTATKATPKTSFANYFKLPHKQATLTQP